MSRSLLSTAASICVGSLLLLGCQPTESGSTGTSVGPTTTVADNNEDGDGNNGGGNSGNGNGGNTGDANASAALSCDALRAADARLIDLATILGNLTQPVLDQARAGDAGGLDPRTIGKTLGVMKPLAAPGSDMAGSLASIQPVLDLLSASLQADVELSPTALADLQAGGGVVAAAAEKLQDALKDNCPASGAGPSTSVAPTTTVAPTPTEGTTTTEVPPTTEVPVTTEAPTTTEAPAPTTTEA
jgi:hypothetical protein